MQTINLRFTNKLSKLLIEYRKDKCYAQYESY